MTTSDVRVCIFSPADNAYSETFIRNHIEYLPFDKYVLNGTEISGLSFSGKPLLPPTFFNKLRRRILARLTKHSDFLGEKRLASFLRKHRIQVALIEYGHIGTLFFRTCARLNIPLVVHFHGFDASHRETLENLRSEFQQLFDYSSAVISVSNAMTGRLERMGAPAGKIVFNCYGIDTSLFTASEEKWPVPTFTAVGRFVEKKAPHLTLLAFARAKENNPFIRLIMIGDGPLLPVCKQLARALRMEESVEFAGIRTPAEVSAIVSRSLAFVQHSVIGGDGSAEGTPLAILEAGACGIPVISTRHEGIMDAVIDNETGILVDEFDVDAMSDAMSLLAGNPEIACAMGAKARAHISRNYTLDRHIEKLTETILASCLPL